MPRGPNWIPGGTYDRPTSIRRLRGYSRVEEYERAVDPPAPTPRGTLRSPSRQIRDQATRVQYERLMQEAYEAFTNRQDATEWPSSINRGLEGEERYSHRFCRSLVIRTDLSHLFIGVANTPTSVLRTIRLKLIDDEMELDKFNEPI